jgi:hypothetical protein
MAVTDMATRRVSSSDSVQETVAGLAVIILTILGLASVIPNFLVAVATIVFGVGLVLYGVGAVGEINRFFARRDNGQAMAEMMVNGLSTVFLAGVAGIVLGILALLGIAAQQLVAIAVIAFGGALVISSNSGVRLKSMSLASAADEHVARLTQDAAADSAGMQTLSGLGAIVLGILALAGFAPVVLVLIALLQLGCLAVLSSTFLGTSLTHAFGTGQRG